MQHFNILWAGVTEAAAWLKRTLCLAKRKREKCATRGGMAAAMAVPSFGMFDGDVRGKRHDGRGCVVLPPPYRRLAPPCFSPLPSPAYATRLPTPPPAHSTSSTIYPLHHATPHFARGVIFCLMTGFCRAVLFFAVLAC